MKLLTAAGRTRFYKDFGVFPRQQDLSWIEGREPFVTQILTGDGLTTLFAILTSLDNDTDPYSRIQVWGGLAGSGKTLMSGTQYSLQRFQNQWTINFSVPPPIGEQRILWIF